MSISMGIKGGGEIEKNGDNYSFSGWWRVRVILETWPFFEERLWDIGMTSFEIAK
jgi:hypothetical protein